MLNGCVYIRKRTKKGQTYLYCIKRRAVIGCECCKGCLSKEYKKVSRMVAKNPIKKVSKKRITVSKETYNIVLERCKDIEGVPHCQFCNAVDNLQLHHVLYRGERKDLIDDPDNCLMLCHRDFSKNKCHRLVHSNKKKYQPILLNMVKEK